MKDKPLDQLLFDEPFGLSFPGRQIVGEDLS